MDTLWIRGVYSQLISYPTAVTVLIVQSFLMAIWLWFGGNFEFERFSIKDLLRPLSVFWKASCSRQTLEKGVKQEYRINTDSPSSVRMTGVRFYDNNE